MEDDGSDQPREVGPTAVEIPIPQLPSELTTLAHEHIRHHSVAMFATERDDDGAAITCSATLVSVDGTPALLTARHVWEVAKRRPILALMVNGRVYRLETSLLDACVVPASGRLPGEEAAVPDIALICLSMEHRAVIEARGKVFYSIDRRLATTDFDKYGDDGFYVVFGSPAELLDFQAKSIASFLYDIGVERPLSHDGWDYSYVRLDLDANPEIPRDYGGVSGGGLWRVKFRVSEDRKTMHVEMPSRDIVLVGVLFYQSATQGLRLIAHGPNSVYEGVVSAFRGSKGRAC